MAKPKFVTNSSRDPNPNDLSFFQKIRLSHQTFTELLLNSDHKVPDPKMNSPWSLPSRNSQAGWWNRNANNQLSPVGSGCLESTARGGGSGGRIGHASRCWGGESGFSGGWGETETKERKVTRDRRPSVSRHSKVHLELRFTPLKTVPQALKQIQKHSEEQQHPWNDSTENTVDKRDV